jgi:SpoVK/Ycf46/Vps4 family AAA+-type ATPase
MVGDAEAAVRRAFSVARRASPALLFLDEIDALVGDRGTPEGGALKIPRAEPLSVEARVLSTFLNELDGIEAKHQNEVTVVAATNRPDCLDAAILRPGRLESLISVSAPDEGARRAILAVHLRSVPFGRFVNVEALSTTTSGFAGADLMGVCREAALERVLV